MVQSSIIATVTLPKYVGITFAICDHFLGCQNTRKNDQNSNEGWSTGWGSFTYKVVFVDFYFFILSFQISLAVGSQLRRRCCGINTRRFGEETFSRNNRLRVIIFNPFTSY